MNTADDWREEAFGRLARKLGIPRVDAHDRAFLENDGRLEAYGSFDDVQRDEIAEDLARTVRLLRIRDSKLADPERTEEERYASCAQRQPPQEEKGRTLELLSEYEAERAEAFSEYLAARAAEREDVRDTRLCLLACSPFGEDQEVCESLSALMRQVAENLARAYPWSEEQANSFLLTGESPWVSPAGWEIRGRPRLDHDHCRIVVNVDARVSADVVQRVFLEAQRKLLGTWGNRRPEPRSLRFYRFVLAERRHDHSSGWPDLMERWNEAYPQRRFDRPADCSRTFRRAEMFLAQRYDWCSLEETGPSAEAESS